MALLRDALFNPDVIRQRSAIDAFRAAGPDVAESMSQTLAAVLRIVDSTSSFPQFVRERSLAYLGMLGRVSAISAVEEALRASTETTAAQAIATAGDLAHLHPDETVWLQTSAWQKVAMHADEEDVVLAGIGAVVASRNDPRTKLAAALSQPSDAIASALAWADQVRADPRSARP
jgi:hypothetical protein